MPELVTRATDLRVGDYVYDNRAAEWYRHWTRITKLERGAADNVLVTTTQRFFALAPTDHLLVKS